MKKVPAVIVILLASATLIFTKCSENQSTAGAPKADSSHVAGGANGGFENQIKYGEHLVLISGCHDCHTPKKMTPTGPSMIFP
ncbi:MAG: hypothetical protein WKI04_07600 [Ferruginibacter sp.]